MSKENQAGQLGESAILPHDYSEEDWLTFKKASGPAQDGDLIPVNTLKDARPFATGAVRQDKRGLGKGRFDLLPFWAVAHLYTEPVPPDDSSVEPLAAVAQWVLWRDLELITFVCRSILSELDSQAADSPPVAPRPFGSVAGHGWLAVARVFEDGADAHGARNWEKGLPYSSFLDSGCRHYCKHCAGATDEPHLAMAAWNFLCLLDTILRVGEEVLPRDLDDLPPIPTGL